MARLTIQKIAAPDLSSVSGILENSNESFNQGINSASKLLDKYELGQQEKNDNSILGEIAKLNSEEELGNFINSGALEGINLSSKMRDTILGLRNNILKNDGTRASTANTRSSTSNASRTTDANIRRTNSNIAIAEAAEGRAASSFADSVANREAVRGTTGSLIDSIVEGRRTGNVSGVEGDKFNAGYWYRRANKTYPSQSLDDERDHNGRSN